MPDLSLKPTVGLARGATIQFAIGRWPDAIGSGVALSEEAFDAVEPHLRSAWQDWPPEGRYGATELPPPAVSALVQRLRSEAQSGSAPRGREAELLSELADWLEAQRHSQQPISILGI